ncbi:MAG TPA: DUF58 domain-containing protein, partial [Flavisolibacter sp.]|nr:DUF58 domain-containing protein [Flavisolibacter sp.]
MLKRLLVRWEETSFYLNRVVYYALFGVVILFCISYFLPGAFIAAIILLIGTVASVIIDSFLVYRYRQGITASRNLADRFSNGDENKVEILIGNRYEFNAAIRVIDELPFQFQERNWFRDLTIKGGSSYTLDYSVHPKERGQYEFRHINIYVQGPLRLMQRRYIFHTPQTVKVYPSYVQMRRFQLMAVANQQQETGVRKMRKLGHSMEFEQIKEYVNGDDYRTINWKATARRGDWMVNNFTDERSQQIYCLIN